jgi:putative hydrolase of the HAD superfamily
MDNIKTLILDFGGVIINLTRNRCIEAFESLGVDDVRESVVNNYQHKDMFKQLELGTITPVQFRDNIRKMTTQTLTDAQIDDAWIAMLDDIPQYKLDLIIELKKKYKVLLLSNTNEIHWKWSVENWFDKGGRCLSDYFDNTYLSYEMHMLKPDAEIFEEVLKKENIDPKDTFFIDDALVNCKAAETLGIRTYTPQPREDWSFLFE